MRVIVTGCSGFTGSKIFERLVSNGHNCIGVTRKTELADYYVVKSYYDCPLGDVLIHCAKPAVVSQVNCYEKEKLKNTIELNKALVQKPFKKVI